MTKTKSFLFAAMIAAAGLASSGAAVAQEEGGHSSPSIERQDWSFGGIFGTYDQNQLQRGFQVFREVCANCHGADLISFRNLSEPGGPEFSEDQVRALAAEYQAVDAISGELRPAVPADAWPSPFASDQEARDANGGALPPDFSVLAKARGVTDPFPNWMFNYFTGYQEGGADYIHALLTHYVVPPPEGVEVAPGQYYNEVYPGHLIGMAPPLLDGLVDYVEGEGGVAAPETVDQYSTDVAAFMMWMAEPHLVSRKETGFRVLLFLVLFAGLMWATKNRLWKGIEH